MTFHYSVTFADGSVLVTDRESAMRCLSMNDDCSKHRANRIIQTAEGMLSKAANSELVWRSGTSPRNVAIVLEVEDAPA